jgi:hypothetical protein
MAYSATSKSLAQCGTSDFGQGVTHYKQPNSAKCNRNTLGVLGAGAIRFQLASAALYSALFIGRVLPYSQRSTLGFTYSGCAKPTASNARYPRG